LFFSSFIFPGELDGIAPTIAMLRGTDPSVVLAATGAIQNLAREVKSRQIILDGGAVEPLIDILFCDDVQTQATAAGALLNVRARISLSHLSFAL
jgi:hypothetical protein